mgnify:CR=1 FL=1
MNLSETEVILSEEVKRKLALPFVKMSMGAGLHTMKPLDEWINQDGCANPENDLVCTWDDIPLPDKCIDHMEMGDIIEHLVMWNRDRILKNWFRLIKIGGTIRISTPNLHRTMVDYANGKITLELAIQNIYAWMSTPYEQHYYTYTVETLTKVLQDYGFDKIDFSESPAGTPTDKSMSWWLVCSAVKVKDV